VTRGDPLDGEMSAGFGNFVDTTMVSSSAASETFPFCLSGCDDRFGLTGIFRI
jgi:hypothetical protein